MRNQYVKIRKLIFLVTAFLISFGGWSQEYSKKQVGQLLDSTKILIERGELGQALFITKQAYEIDSTLGRTDSLTVKVCDSYTIIFIELEKPDSAQMWLDSCHFLLKELGAENDLIAVDIYSTSGFFYAVQGDHDLSLMYKQKARSICERILGNQHVRTGDMIRNIARYHLTQGNFKEALHYYELAHNTYLKSEKPNQSKLARTYLGMGVCYRYLGDLLKSIDLSKKGVAIWEVDSTAKYLDLVKAYASLATSYSYNSQYDNAEKFFLKAIRRIEKKEGVNNHRMIRSYFGLADVYILSKNYNKAIRYANQAKTLVETVYGDSRKHLFFWSYGLLASAYLGKGDCHKAIDNYNLALKYGTIRPIARARMYTGLGSSYDACNNMKLALDHFMKAVEILFSTQGRMASDLKETYESIARLYSKSGDYEMSRSFYIKQLEVSESLLNPDHPDLLVPNLGLMNCASHLGDEEDFIRKEKKIIALLKYDVNNPENFETVTDLFQLSIYLRLKADHLIRRVESSSSIVSALEKIYETALLVEERIQSGFVDKETQNDHFKNSFVLYEKAIGNLNNQKNQEANERAFAIMEKSKSRSLRGNIQKIFAEKWSGVPEELIERENELNGKISFYEKKLFEQEYEANQPSDSLIKEYKDEIFAVKEEYEELQKELKLGHSDYYQLMYENPVVSVKEIQESLGEDQTLLEYFVGEKDLFIFIIRGSELRVKRVGLDFPLKEWVEELRKSVFRYWTLSDQSKETYEERNSHFTGMGFKLYEKLVSPVEDYLSEELIIVPDGVLNYLPFELLLKKPVEEGEGFGSFSYFIKDHQVSYHYSATLWNRDKDKGLKKNEGKGLFLAPEFKEDTVDHNSIAGLRSALGPLEYGELEVQNIRELIGGGYFVRASSNKKGFFGTSKQISNSSLVNTWEGKRAIWQLFLHCLYRRDRHNGYGQSIVCPRTIWYGFKC